MGPPPQGPGFGFGSGGFPPPRKKKSKAPFIVIPIVAVLGLGLVAAWIYGVVEKNKRLADGYTPPEPTYSATENPTAGSTEGPFPVTSSAPTQAATTQAPPPVKTTAPRPTRTTPPPPTNNDLVTKNRLYKSGAQKTVKCREPATKPSSIPNARKYYTGILLCLERGWPRQVVTAGGRFRAPKLIVYSGPVTSPCSGGSATGYFYCSGNETIYLDAGQDVTHFGQYNQGWGSVYTRANMTDTISHEFGHHVQFMTGILSAEDDMAYESGAAKALELSRRLELQASCLGNVFMSANKNTYPISGEFKKDLDFQNSHSGDEYNPAKIRDHGSRFSYARWTKAGFTGGVRSCNTFVAPAGSVG
jgi:predicted metalloprotease